MKKYSYDRKDAKLLLPLLESIGTEIQERKRSIRLLEKRITGIADDDSEETQMLNLKADLAEHRRGLRTSRAELDKLGCQEGQKRGKLFLIPGQDGTLESGFRWEHGQETLQRVQTDISAA
ncbi:MAG: hypothetical protein ACI841_004055 [Planctomycetota bacterium]|jgi:hypothetical protein